MKGRYILLFFIGLFVRGDGSVFFTSISEGDSAAVFELIMGGHVPTPSDLVHSNYRLSLVFRRFSDEERLQFGQFLDRCKMSMPHGLPFSLAQVRKRGPSSADLIINCMIRYPAYVKNYPESLLGLPLGWANKWIVAPGIVEYIIGLRSIES